MSESYAYSKQGGESAGKQARSLRHQHREVNSSSWVLWLYMWLWIASRIFCDAEKYPK